MSYRLPIGDGLLSGIDAARIVGLHPATVRRMTSQGIIPASKIGKNWRYRRDELEAWILSRRNTAEMLRVGAIRPGEVYNGIPFKHVIQAKSGAKKSKGDKHG